MTKENIEKCCSNCVKVPNSSLFALITLICGLCLISGSFISLGERLRHNEFFAFHNYYNILKLILVCVIPFMMMMGVILIICSILLSGNTRKTLFWGRKRRACALVLNSFLFFMVYILFFAWFFVTCAILYPFLMTSYYQFYACKFITSNECIDAKLLFLKSANGTEICNDKRFKLCSQMNDYLVTFSILLAGSFLTMYSLLHFIINISSNHAYIKSDGSKKLLTNEIEDPVVEETKM